MKIYARQIDPEYQESPLFFAGCFPEKVYTFGNRDYIKRAEKLDLLLDNLIDAQNEHDDMRHGFPTYKTWADALADLIPPDETRGEYTRADRLKWRELFRDHDFIDKPTDPDGLSIALSLVTGTAYTASTLRGCCQGDWQYIIYPEEYGDEWRAAFETEYFNMGTEWEIHDEETPPETPDDITGFTMYCHAGDDDSIKKEIVDAYGGNMDDDIVILYKFDGYTKTPKYKEV